MKSEFGKGLTYCLGLFLAHAERMKEHKKTEEMLESKKRFKGKELWAEMWFNGASDHLYELTIPKKFLRKKFLYELLDKIFVKSFIGKYLRFFGIDFEKEFLQKLKRYSEVVKRIYKFKNKCIHWGHGFPEKGAKWEDVEWAIDEAKYLLREIDNCFGIETIKGDWK